MFCHAGFNHRGHRIIWAKVACEGGDGVPRWTRLWRFECGDFGWISRSYSWASWQLTYVENIICKEPWKLPRWPGRMRLCHYALRDMPIYEEET